MDITFTDDQDKYRAGIRTWLAENLPDSWTEADHWPQLDEDAEQAFLIDWERRLYAAGYSGIAWPKAYGGQGLGPIEDYIVNEEIGLAEAPESLNTIGRELVAPILLSVGTEDQKLRYIPRILQMDDIWCQGFSEPNAGSDLAGLRTKAERTADGWVVNGQKIWTSGASKSTRILLLARTGSVEDRHRGLVLFALRSDTPGVDIREIQSIDGERSFCEVFFNDVVIPDADMLGSPDDGWAAATRVLSIERATNRMHRSWRFENQLQHLVSACAANPATRRMVEVDYARQLADVSVNIELLKGHVETLVGSLIDGEEIGPRGSLPKLFWSEAHQSFAKLALEITSQFPPDMSDPLRAVRRRMEDIYIKARAETIYAGTTEIQLGIIAKRILKLNGGK